jgi:hypothetical protein
MRPAVIAQQGRYEATVKLGVFPVSPELAGRVLALPSEYRGPVRDL